jgi:hypothetical protein
MGEFTVHNQGQAQWNGLFITVHNNGQVYISSKAYEEFFDEEDNILVMIDTESMRIGFKPIDENTGESSTLNNQKMGCSSAFEKLGVQLPEKTERYPVQTSEEHDFPFIVLAEDTERSSPGGQPEESTLRSDNTSELPNHFVKTSDGNLHAPSEDSTVEEPEPNCSSNTPENGWMAKRREQIPVDFYEHCSFCEDKIEEMFDRG